MVVLKVKNISNKSFTFKYDGNDYTVKSREIKDFPLYLAMHGIEKSVYALDRASGDRVTILTADVNSKKMIEINEDKPRTLVIEDGLQFIKVKSNIEEVYSKEVDAKT